MGAGFPFPGRTMVAVERRGDDFRVSAWVIPAGIWARAADDRICETADDATAEAFELSKRTGAPVCWDPFWRPTSG